MYYFKNQTGERGVLMGAIQGLFLAQYEVRPYCRYTKKQYLLPLVCACVYVFYSNYVLRDAHSVIYIYLYIYYVQLGLKREGPLSVGSLQ